MPDGAPQTVLRVLAAVNPAIEPRHVDLARTYTNTFADEAEAVAGR
jgi:NitT/TauT family transport system substrate-binding protein